MSSIEDKIGVIIGRFQPFHLGHAWLLKKSLERFDKLIIIIGSSNKNDKKNLWSFEKRKEMLEKFLESENIRDKVLKIEKVDDVPDDNDWLEKTLKKIDTEKFTVIGDNEWVNGIFENAGYKVERPGYFKREKYEGEEIRKMYLKDLGWEDRVPDYISSIIKKN